MWDYHWKNLNLTLFRTDKVDTPFEAIGIDRLPMHHLWQYYYSLAHSVAFVNPTGLYDEDEKEKEDDEEDGDLYDDFDWDSEGLPF